MGATKGGTLDEELGAEKTVPLATLAATEVELDGTATGTMFGTVLSAGAGERQAPNGASAATTRIRDGVHKVRCDDGLDMSFLWHFPTPGGLGGLAG